ncbi:hypothetical protein [uncultured Porphyromonas sp.]|uniref:hypothetical protein n=1 Tax=uncultured Porphyromonas sp. TaxID=159274 RepID=UPI00258EFFAC|nr:hypothetical protein [uncultured Porphyromonas sp.]
MRPQRYCSDLGGFIRGGTFSDEGVPFSDRGMPFSDESDRSDKSDESDAQLATATNPAASHLS